ncbi:MAG: putative peptidoglycan biosynthesis protein MurJ [Pelotomaculum sp. PtaU1.Bin035]|nr:MAG: putative peptidoglycan biosynthesis protein MurJ [Pelotomaculum sp. PtaU1.Bin035]
MVKKSATGVMIFKITILIAFFNLLSRFLGLIRDMVIARQFGASAATDAYLVAFTAPNLLFFIISGSLAAVVVPVFIEFSTKKDKHEAWRIFNTVFNTVTILFFIISAAGILGAAGIVRLIAPMLPDETAKLAAELAAIMFPLLIFSGWASLFAGLLNANNIFGIPAFSNVANNLVIIISALTLGSIYGIYGLAAGTVIAMAIMAFIQIPALIRAGCRYSPALELGHPGVKKVFRLIMPAALGITVNQAYILIERIFASGMPSGSISSLNFANKLVQFPISLFVLALGTAVFPTLTRLSAIGEREEFSYTLTRLLKIMILGMVPASAGLIVLRYPIVALLFQRGEFDQRAVELTSVALLFYSVGLAGQAANIILTKAFYSLQDTRTPVKLTLITVLVNLVLSVLLIRFFQHGGLALANSLASLTGTALFMIFLNKKVAFLKWVGFLKFTLSVLAATGLTAVASYGVSAALAGFADARDAFGLAFQVGTAVLAGVAVFTASAVAFRIEEFYILWNFLKGFITGGRENS